MPTRKELEQTKRLMDALVRMQPKPHDEIRLKPKVKKAKSPKKTAKL